MSLAFGDCANGVSFVMFDGGHRRRDDKEEEPPVGYQYIIFCPPVY